MCVLSYGWQAYSLLWTAETPGGLSLAGLSWAPANRSQGKVQGHDDCQLIAGKEVSQLSKICLTGLKVVSGKVLDCFVALGICCFLR